jgi:hypothetical protein
VLAHNGVRLTSSLIEAARLHADPGCAAEHASSMPTLRRVCPRKQQLLAVEQNIHGSRWEQIRALDAAHLQVNNPSVAANSATGFCSPNTLAHTAPLRKPALFYARTSRGVVCRFSGGGVRGAARLAGPSVRSANPHTVRHPFRRSGWRLHAKGVVMENRSAVGGTEPRRCSLIRIGGVVPLSGRRAP